MIAIPDFETWAGRMPHTAPDTQVLTATADRIMATGHWYDEEKPYGGTWEQRMWREAERLVRVE